MTKEIRILKDFCYGNPSHPNRMIKGNTQAVPADVSEDTLAKWVKLQWVEVTEG